MPRTPAEAKVFFFPHWEFLASLQWPSRAGLHSGEPDRGIQPLKQFVLLPVGPEASLWLTALFLLDDDDGDEPNSTPGEADIQAT